MALCTAPGVAIGWKGYAIIGTSLFPYIRTDISENIKHIVAEDIHGGGIGTTHGYYHSQANAAEGQITYEGTINGNVYVGSSGFGTAFKSFLNRAIGTTATDTSCREAGFDSTVPLILSVGGVGLDSSKAFKFPGTDGGRAVISTFKISGNPGGLVTWDANVVAASMDDSSTVPTFPTAYTFESGSDLGAGTPVPYFESSLSFSSDLGEATGFEDFITDWSVDINNNTKPTFTFNGDRHPIDIYQGIMEVTGSFQYFAPDGLFSRLSNGGSLTITLGTSLGSSAIKLFVPYVALDPRPTSVGGPNELTYREVKWRGLADSTGGSIYQL